MTDRDATTDALRERLTDLLAEWGAEMSAVINELDQARQRLAGIDDEAAQRDRATTDLEERVRGQQELIEALQADAEAVPDLRRELNARDVEIERLKSELESKQELMRVLRRDAEEADRLKADVRRREQEVEALRQEKAQLEAQTQELRNTIQELEQAAAQESADEAAEIESLRAELEARKSMIRSLRADAERAQVLEGRLEEKRRLVQQLEGTINRHANTIVELKRAAEAWKRKYFALKGTDDTSTTPALDSLTATSPGARTLPPLPESFAHTDSASVQERTIAIDMRRALLEARRAAQGDK